MEIELIGHHIGFEPSPQPLSELVEACIENAMNEALGKFRDSQEYQYSEDEKDMLQKAALSFIFSDDFDAHCAYIGADPEAFRCRL